MGTLAQQIDIRLHPALYRQATDMMMEYIDASSKLPPHVPGQQLQLPLCLQTPQQPPQQRHIGPNAVCLVSTGVNRNSTATTVTQP